MNIKQLKKELLEFLLTVIPMGTVNEVIERFKLKNK